MSEEQQNSDLKSKRQVSEVPERIWIDSYRDSMNYHIHIDGRGEQQCTEYVRADSTPVAKPLNDVQARTMPRKLTRPELNHLSGLLEARREEGFYTGPREQYYARTERLIKWCNDQLEGDTNGISKND